MWLQNFELQAIADELIEGVYRGKWCTYIATDSKIYRFRPVRGFEGPKVRWRIEVFVKQLTFEVNEELSQVRTVEKDKLIANFQVYGKHQGLKTAIEEIFKC